MVDRYPVKIYKAWVQGVWDDPVRFEEFYERLEFCERRVSPQRAKLDSKGERKRHRLWSGTSNQGCNFLSILQFLSRGVEVVVPVFRSHGNGIHVHDALP